ncbi:MAG: GNAT family N-acetyltransferase [Planctomycetaceae bacterium]|nr:GNAT family N-acetyltransferase [Planctomycetaceae bacterium]
MSTTLAPSITWRIAQPTLADLREPLLALWNRNLPDASRDRFEWLYGTGRADGLLLGDRQIIGGAGLMRRRFAIAGQVIEGGAAIDLNVDAEQRSVGPAMTLARAVMKLADENGVSCLYGFPIPRAAGVLKRCGYRQLGEMSNWTMLLRSEAKLRGVLRSSLAAKLAAPLVDIGLRWKSSESTWRLPQQVMVETPVTFDERFNRLWRTAAQRFGVLGERSSDYLKWRFTKCPELKYECFALTGRGSGELLGYVVWYRSEESICIADLLAVDDSATELLLAEFTRQARRQRADAIRLSCFAAPQFYAQLEAVGFSRRKDSYPVLVRMPDAASDWYLTMADHDTDV